MIFHVTVVVNVYFISSWGYSAVLANSISQSYCMAVKKKKKKKRIGSSFEIKNTRSTVNL